MSQLDSALQTIREHEGVEHVLVLGRDGLLIQHSGAQVVDPETVSAMVPQVAFAAASLGEAAGSGAASMIVAKLERGVAIVCVLSPEILLAVLLRPDTNFSRLLATLATQAPSLAAAI